MAALSGAANALLLAIINRAAEAATTQTRSDRYFFLFVILIGIYVIAQRYLLTRSAEVIETSLDAVRCGLTERLRKADLHPLERINRSTIYSSISKQVVTISQAAPTIIIACQSALMILFSAIYLASLSTAGFLITVLMMVIGVSIHFEKSKELQRDMQSIVIQENGYFDLLTQMLDGFKEVKLNSRRCTAIVERLRATSEAVARLKISYSTRFSSHFLFSQTFFYILVGSIVFLLPRFSPPYSSVVIKMTTAILFIIGPLGGLIGSIPVMTAANVAVKNILDLDELLQTAGSPGEDKLPVHSPPPFHQIHLAGLSFQYEGVSDTAGFGVGPLDLEIRAGEILFLVGGNGSGKSTLLKLITGLYHPAAGEIRLDGAAVRPEDYAAYRSLFSAIFSDYHLFDRLYGIEVKDPGLVQKLLEDFGLDTKTSLDDERWSTVELSSGQRKRLALIVNTLEDRPIQVFDEWAADQDPLFRKRFYEELLPRMRKQGKTIIAATHDDRYFHVADHVLKLEYGQIVAAAGKETV